MTSPWQNFWLNIALIASWVSLGFLYTGDFTRRWMATIGIAYWVGAISVCGIMLGDFALALGYTAEDYWFLERQWRVVFWRYGLVGGQVVIALIMRFGDLDK